ncbi:YpmS family protein [Ligilactobacillus equi]
MERQNMQVKKQTVNFWKWAFIILVATLFLVSGTVISKVITPSEAQVKMEQTKLPTDDYTKIDVSMDKKQLQATINYYLRQSQKKQKIKYRFILNDSAILMGTTKVLGKNISFSLYTIPKLDKNGNIVLQAKSVAVGSLNAPASFILGYIKNNYDLSKGVTINTRKATLTLNLNQFTKKQGIVLKGKQLDVPNNKFLFEVNIPLDSIK